jgi:hypothetical protein
MSDTMTFTTQVEVPMSRVADLLCCAFEGGIGYWACITGYVKPEDFGGTRCHFAGDDAPKYLDYPLSPYGAVLIEDAEDDGHKQYRLDLPAIQRGFKVMQQQYPKHFANWLAENDDAITGDVFVQCCIFGDIIYG